MTRGGVTLKMARAALFAVLPAEALLAVLLVSGVSPPARMIVAAEGAAALVFILEAVTVWRLFGAERRSGAGRRTAARAAVRRLVPRQVRRIMGFDAKGLVSLVLWVTRRRHGVPPGAVAVPYAREQTPTLMILLFVMAVEAVAVEVLLRGLEALRGVRVLMLTVDLYSVLIGLAVLAACVTRPHVVSPGELRVRYGAFFDLRVPRELISSVRPARNDNESGTVTVRDGRLSVAVSSRTNVVVELREPVSVVRPLGRRAEATVIRFFADTPGTAMAALGSLGDGVPYGGGSPETTSSG